MAHMVARTLASPQAAEVKLLAAVHKLCHLTYHAPTTPQQQGEQPLGATE